MKKIFISFILIVYVGFEKLTVQVESQVHGNSDKSILDYAVSFSGQDSQLSRAEELILKLGLAVDYSFNETLSEVDDENKLISAPGCPRSGQNLLNTVKQLHFFQRSFWVHSFLTTSEEVSNSQSSMRCYLVGTQGPCSPGMRVGAQKHSTFGVCRCACYFNRNHTNPFVSENICQDSSVHFIMINGQCYQELTQGPCEVNEVLTIDLFSSTHNCKRVEQIHITPENPTEFADSMKSSFSAEGNVKKSKPQLKSNETLLARRPGEAKTKFPHYKRPPRPAHLTLSPFRIIDPHASYCGHHGQRYSTALKACIPYSKTKLSGVVG